MRRADPSLRTVNRRISRTIFVALVVGAIALLGLGTRPAETQETSAQSLSYKVQDLGTLGDLTVRPRASTRLARWSEHRLPAATSSSMRSSTAVGK
jgi:hypothetical protein